ncbi:MAG TPA: hypothetical protein VID30_05425 [Bradyrhizobium sp.]|jgi:hypothetical protein
MKKSIAALLLGTALSLSAASVASADDKVVKIGSLSDQSGLYADLGGPGSAVAAQMAVEDSGLTGKGWKIDIITGDHNPHDGAKVVAKMKEMPTDDPLFGKGSIEPNGRTIHPAYLFEVKKASESKGPWDYYKLVATIPANEAFTPLDKSTCPLLKK